MQAKQKMNFLLTAQQNARTHVFLSRSEGHQSFFSLCRFINRTNTHTMHPSKTFQTPIPQVKSSIKPTRTIQFMPLYFIKPVMESNTPCLRHPLWNELCRGCIVRASCHIYRRISVGLSNERTDNPEMLRNTTFISGRGQMHRVCVVTGSKIRMKS